MTDVSPTAPALRRLWVVVLFNCLLITFPVALAILASGPVYKRTEGGFRAITGGARWTWAGFLALWLVALVAKAAIHPGDWQTVATAPTPAASTGKSPAAKATTEPSAPPPQQPAAQEAAADGPPGCTDPAFRQTVLEAVNNGFDKAGLPREPEDEQAAGNLIELDGPLWLTARRSVVANSNGEIKLEEVRVCGTKDQNGGVGLVTVIVIQHGGELGGGIQNTGLPSVIPFGKQF